VLLRPWLCGGEGAKPVDGGWYAYFPPPDDGDWPALVGDGLKPGGMFDAGAMTGYQNLFRLSLACPRWDLSAVLSPVPRPRIPRKDLVLDVGGTANSSAPLLAFLPAQTETLPREGGPLRFPLHQGAVS
jgi:hypothetical protein